MGTWVCVHTAQSGFITMWIPWALVHLYLSPMYPYKKHWTARRIQWTLVLQHYQPPWKSCSRGHSRLYDWSEIYMSLDTLLEMKLLCVKCWTLGYSVELRALIARCRWEDYGLQRAVCFLQGIWPSLYQQKWGKSYLLLFFKHSGLEQILHLSFKLSAL